MECISDVGEFELQLVKGASMVAFEQGSSTGGMGGMDRPELGCLSSGFGGQVCMQAAQSVRELDGALIYCGAVRSCDIGL